MDSLCPMAQGATSEALALAITDGQLIFHHGLRKWHILGWYLPRVYLEARDVLEASINVMIQLRTSQCHRPRRLPRAGRTEGGCRQRG